MPNILILGGPNGAGKTTTSKRALPNMNIETFVNADEIARGLSPLEPEGAALAAGRLMLDQIRDLVERRQDFAFETTLAGRNYATWLRRCKAAGWQITLLYVWLSSPEMAIERVAHRIIQGGHSILRDTIIRRYWAGLANFHELYLPLADDALIYDNSGHAARRVARRSQNRPLIIYDEATWQRIRTASP